MPNAVVAASRALDRAVRRVEDAESIRHAWLPSRQEIRMRGVRSGIEQAEYATKLLSEHVVDAAALRGRLTLTVDDVERAWPASGARTREVLEQVRSIRDDVRALADLGVASRADFDAVVARLRELPAGEWTADDLEAARAVQHVTRGDDIGLHTYRNRVLERVVAGAGLDLGDQVARRAQAYQSTWAHPDRESATRRMLELVEDDASELDPARWREIHALLYDLPSNIRPQVEELHLPAQQSNVVATTRMYFPGFGDFHVNTGIRMGSREAHQAAILLAGLGEQTPLSFRQEFVHTMGDDRLVTIRKALDPTYLPRVEADLRAVLAAGGDPRTTGHAAQALGEVGGAVLRDVPDGLEVARIAAMLAEVAGGRGSLPFWAAIGREVDNGWFAAMPGFEDELRTLVDRNIGRIDGTVAHELWYARVPDYADLGRVQAMIDTTRAVAADAGAAAPRSVRAPGTITW